jgi:branched-chain amino acid aminotransferase
MYTNGKYHSVRLNNASTLMQAFNYGTAAFEGMKAFYQRDKHCWFLFRPDQHYARLKRSAAALGIDLAMTFDEFVGVISKLIKKNDLRTDVYIRPLVYRSEKGVGVSRPSGYGLSVFIQSMTSAAPRAFRCCFVSQRRPVDGSYAIKISGNYVLSFFSQREATQQSRDIGILLSVNGYVSEASVMNLFFVKEGKLFTPSLACGPLDGITRKSLMELAAKELRIRVFEGKYHTARLLEADEVFLCGTGSGINYVRQIEGRTFKLSCRNLLAPRLRALYGDVVHGKVSQRADWLLPVH